MVSWLWLSSACLSPKYRFLICPFLAAVHSESPWKSIGTCISTMRILRHQDVPFWDPAHWCLWENQLSVPSRKVEAEIQMSISPHLHPWTNSTTPWSIWVLLHLVSFLQRYQATRRGCSQGFCSHQAQLWKIYCVLSQKMTVSMTALPSQCGDKGCHLGSSMQLTSDTEAIFGPRMREMSHASQVSPPVTQWIHRWGLQFSWGVCLEAFTQPWGLSQRGWEPATGAPNSLWELWLKAYFFCRRFPLASSSLVPMPAISEPGPRCLAVSTAWKKSPGSSGLLCTIGCPGCLGSPGDLTLLICLKLCARHLWSFTRSS